LVPDIVVWDSHPLALGAAPRQVFIDGIAQLENPHVVPKPVHAQQAPKTPNFDEEARLAVKYDGLPPLIPQSVKSQPVLFTNVGQVHMSTEDGSIDRIFSDERKSGIVLVEDGKVRCVVLGNGVCDKTSETKIENLKIVDLHGGSIA